MRPRVPDSQHRGWASRLVLAGLLALPAAGTAAADTLVEFNVVARENGPAITDGVDLHVWSRNGKRAIRKVAEFTGAPTKLHLEPDEYRVVARYRHARSITDIEVGVGESMSTTLNLNLGGLELELLRCPGASPVRHDVSWTVHPYRRGKKAAPPLVETQEPVPALGLSAGWYKVAAHHGAETYTHIVEVSAGRSLTYSLFMK
ncbi:hypothetical protein [Rhodovibrio salinarum]|uniref:Carboxypeptidase regulatory-like domain-containing protein n=1 Tax=Rhodovibrio salinarum TaxID=1087 RepID=A0A934V0U1_9PROT|nr:hypothetical protein [Rhodovibrio salinarum]MBK1697439.1 hypothetical protein [Rhodovibrio salinarum]